MCPLAGDYDGRSRATNSYHGVLGFVPRSRPSRSIQHQSTPEGPTTASQRSIREDTHPRLAMLPTLPSPSAQSRQPQIMSGTHTNQAHEARDELFGLRECRRTFQTYLKQYESSDPEHVKEKTGKSWFGPSSLATRDKFRNKSVTEAIATAFQGARMWDIVSHRVNDVQQHSKPTEEFRQAMYRLKGFF